MEIVQINGHVIGKEINKCIKRMEMSKSMGWKGGIGNLRSWLRSKFRRISPLILGVLYG